jgi:hypothetical protein
MSDGASGPTTLSDTSPARLIQSTGNLYWSSNGAAFDGIQSFIFRASKSSSPGEEIQIYAEPEPSSDTDEFEALTFAKVNDEFYGYFVANYQGLSQIKRIPLAGGPAVVLAGSPATIGHGDLVTDGAFLCWADGEGIRSMPIGGGPVATLSAGQGFARLAVLGETVYFIDGKAILSVPAGGGTPSNVAGDRFSPITALHVLEVQPPVALAERLETPPVPIVQNVALVWGRADGAVCGMFPTGTATYQEPTVDTTVVSVFSTGTRILWSDVYNGPEGFACHVRMWSGGATTTLYSSPSEFSITDVLADEEAAYWTGLYVEKYTF